MHQPNTLRLTGIRHIRLQIVAHSFGSSYSYSSSFFFSSSSSAIAILVAALRKDGKQTKQT